MTEYGRKAGELFSAGYNCAQSVAGAFCEKLGIELPTMVKLASSFGGGVAGTREMCGTVSGMLVAAGLLRGYSDPAAREEKQEHYAFCRSLMDEFEQKSGSIICREFLTMQKSGEKGKLSCHELCILAADILAEKAKI